MNIAQAKQIPVQKITEMMGGKLSHQKTGEAWFFSPFRPDEKTASFKVNEKLNTWYDFAEGKGGSGLDLWLDYHQRDRKDGKAIREALNSLKDLSATTLPGIRKRAAVTQPGDNGRASKPMTEPPHFKLTKQPGKIWMDSLRQEIARRGLSMETVTPYLKQVSFKDNKTEKNYTGLAFPNDKDGLEISIPNPAKGTNFKTNIGAKSPTSLVTGKFSRAVVFEGFWDFFTWLEMNQGRGEHEIFVLNSLSFVGETAKQISTQKDKIKQVFLFLDNDEAGQVGTQNMADLLQPEGFTIGSMNHDYEGYKDLNDYWINCSTARFDAQKKKQRKSMYSLSTKAPTTKKAP